MNWGWSGFGEFSLVRETRARISITEGRRWYVDERGAGSLEGQKLLLSGEMRDDFPQTRELRPFGKSHGTGEHFRQSRIHRTKAVSGFLIC